MRRPIGKVGGFYWNNTPNSLPLLANAQVRTWDIRFSSQRNEHLHIDSYSLHIRVSYYGENILGRFVFFFKKIYSRVTDKILNQAIRKRVTEEKVG